MQRRIVRQGVSLFETIEAPGATVCSDEQWCSDDQRDRYMAVTDDDRAELPRAGEALRERRASRERRAE